MEILSEIEAICSEVSQREGCKLYDVELIGNAGNRVLRVFIDSEDGVGIDECTNVSRALNLRLDVEDIVPGGAYNLEVSSPGLERKLRRREHFSSAVGKQIVIKTQRALGEYGLSGKAKKKAKQCRVKLLEIKLNEAQIECLVCQIGEDQLEVPLPEINKAHVYFDFEETKKKKGRKK